VEAAAIVTQSQSVQLEIEAQIEHELEGPKSVR
jgi:hypothetical protein